MCCDCHSLTARDMPGNACCRAAAIQLYLLLHCLLLLSFGLVVAVDTSMPQISLER